MDINVDQGEPRGDLSRFEDGKYLYKLDDGKFDIDKFNRDFDQYKEKRKQEMAIRLQKRLDELNNPPPPTPAYDLSIGQLAINTKDALFNILDDIINFKFSKDILMKENRLFYIGLTLIIFAIAAYMYFVFIPKKPEMDGSGKIIHVHEIKFNTIQNGAAP